MLSLIAFVSDFGLGDTWVGVCHAYIIRACPQARIVDLAHDVPPFDIRRGAAVAAAGVYQLPDAIHLIVVDPGVGGGRRDLCVVTRSGARLVGPDNGVLLPAAERVGGIAAAYAIDRSRLDGTGPLPTFHARDVLAPAAAALSCGVDAAGLGEEVSADELVQAPFQLATTDGVTVKAEVVDRDRFGSLRFAVPGERISEYGLDAPKVDIALGHHSMHVPFARTFSDVAEGDPVLLVDSSGWLTLALNRDSAVERYGVELGTVAHLRPAT